MTTTAERTRSLRHPDMLLGIVVAVTIILTFGALLAWRGSRSGSPASAAEVASSFVHSKPHNDICAWPDGEQLGSVGQTASAEQWQILYQGSPANVMVILVPDGDTWKVSDYQLDSGLGPVDCGKP